MENSRQVVAIFEVDDALAEKLGFGTMCTSGIEVIDSRIIDDDDLEDSVAINAVKKIFN